MSDYPAPEFDRVLYVFEGDGTVWAVDPDDAPVVRAAVLEFMATGEDALVDLTTLGGSDVTLLVSCIGGWRVATREQRQRDLDVGAALEAERTRNRWNDDE